MGPNENPTRHGERQAAHGRKRSSRPPRTRRCLLKGCAQRFRPRHARQRYCCDGCRKAARTWSEWKARQKYRVKAACKQKRNEQSRRYRERVKERKPPEKEVIPEAARVIPKKLFDRACNRPGCYECFVRSRRSPLQRFCSRACQRAMERVWERERRWHRRHARRRPLPGRGPREGLP